MLYKAIEQCRICKNKELTTVLDLGHQALTGVFPNVGEDVEIGPLVLVKCSSEGGCGLLQLGHDYDMEKLYGDNYGYRSGLNKGMIKHLGEIVEKIKAKTTLEKGDLIIDIASNDSTMLQFYGDNGYDLLGVDPTSKKFSEYYPSYISYISDFFSANVVKNKTTKKAKVISSVAMFYDLPDPVAFAQDVKEMLTDDGIWVLEQSYMPTMIDMVAYDTVCHEHLEYYALRQIAWIANHIGMKIIDIELNDTNGGSFLVFISKDTTRVAEEEKILKQLQFEDEGGYTDGRVFTTFRDNIEQHKKDLLAFLEQAQKEGKKVYGYGASTKGNVTLQYCDISKELVPHIMEVNEYKFGRTTPGTLISIISEQEGHSHNPDYLLVLPWHFKAGILDREKEYLEKGGKIVFPLPYVHIEG